MLRILRKLRIGAILLYEHSECVERNRDRGGAYGNGDRAGADRGERG